MKRAAHIPATSGGFALVIVAALFVALAVVVAAIIDHDNSTRQMTQRDVTLDRMHRISAALLQYYTFRLDPTSGLSASAYPCPSAANVAATDASFGMAFTSSIPTTPSCDTKPPSPAPAGATLETLTGGNVVRGMVPVQQLAPYGISDDDAFDAWGDRIMYVVNLNLTAPGGSTSYIYLNSTTTASPTGTGPTKQPAAQPAFVLISYGPDKLGGYPRAGTAVAIPCSSATGNRALNCGTDPTKFYQAPAFTSADAGAASYFDDLLVYYTQ